MRRTANPLSKILFGLLAIVVAVVGFSVYQSSQTAPQPATVSPTNSAVGNASSTVPTATSNAAQPTFNAPTLYRVVAEKANLSAEIVELYFSTQEDNWDVSRLLMYAGHLQGTPDFKHGGNFVLAGHVEMADGSAGPFAQIGNLAPGDLVTILSSKVNGAVAIQYKVTAVKRVSPDAFVEVRNHGYEELTLITCADWNPNDRSYHTRLVVHARPV